MKKPQEHRPTIFMRRLIDGEIDPPPRRDRPDPEPARCTHCKCEDHIRPLFRAFQLMGAEWVTCARCFTGYGRVKVGLNVEFESAVAS